MSVDQPLALVWIDSREAVVASWQAGTVEVERVQSDVPAHRRSTGHVRHDPTTRHGGGGPPQSAGEPRRLEHLARFLADVEHRLPQSADLLLLGPGMVHERLAREIRAHDMQHRVSRSTRCEVAPRMTRRQLIARLRLAAGDRPRRRTVGAYRWTDPTPADTPGSCAGTPRRVVAKRWPTVKPIPEEVT
jgi:hypothetical protein